MHPADQVVAFAKLNSSGVSVSAIAARFGVTERLVEQRLSLGAAAPGLLDAYRAEEMDLDTLKAFTVTTDHARQMAVWEQVKEYGYGPSGWQVRRLLTEENVSALSGCGALRGRGGLRGGGGYAHAGPVRGRGRPWNMVRRPRPPERSRGGKTPRGGGGTEEALEVGRCGPRGRLERDLGLRADKPRAGRSHR